MWRPVIFVTEDHPYAVPAQQLNGTAKRPTPSEFGVDERYGDDRGSVSQRVIDDRERVAVADAGGELVDRVEGGRRDDDRVHVRQLAATGRLFPLLLATHGDVRRALEPPDIEERHCRRGRDHPHAPTTSLCQ